MKAAMRDLHASLDQPYASRGRGAGIGYSRTLRIRLGSFTANGNTVAMNSRTFLRDFASCVSCEWLIMVAKFQVGGHDKRRSIIEPTFHITCYTCELAGASVPPKQEGFVIMHPLPCVSARLL